MAKRKEQPPEEGSPAWMATFSDLMNLLLCFFVLLFASSTMDEGKIQKIAASFDNVTFSVLDQGSISLVEGGMLSGGVSQVPDANAVLTEAGKNIEDNSGDEVSSSSTDAEMLSDEELKQELDKRGEEQSEEMYNEVVQMAESYSIDTIISIDYNEQYVELDLNGSILFDSGSAQIKEDSKMFLQKIARILTKYKYCI
ncbi:MAG: chemotaxis protein, partial [Lachnospiraceae bacterium]|nr:chemotaxis protein [Lachnospiraceae bacterium]